ncbi:multiple epidermal growth factor-like domains protein 10 isoform X2 [Magallana gigas]|uniref:multiple epidermal growth factor-like domains protein 10 isoform X2 n=1 Tax=Magallana gigas TaxID=29159 RepID=UPI00333EB605
MILHRILQEVPSVVFYFLQLALYHYLMVAASSNNCEGKPHECCAGYTFNATLDTCVECDVGFYNTTCSSPCPYPTYGRDCQNICNCTQNMCNIVQGCLKDIEISENGTAVISKKIAQRKQGVSTNSAMTSALTGLVSLSVLVLIAYAIQKRYGGREKPMLDIMEMGQREKPDKSNNL